MKNINKYILFCTIGIIFLLLWQLIIPIETKKLRNYSINTKVIVTFEGEEDIYELDLNNETYKKYSGKYMTDVYFINDRNIKIYNNSGTAYITLYGLYDNDDKELYSSYSYHEDYYAFWVNNEYLIRTDRRIVRFLGYFFGTTTAENVITIVESKTGKNKQFLFKKDGNYLKINSILGYTK